MVKKEGKLKKYLDNGQLVMDGAYKNDKQDGLWVMYYDNGKKHSEIHFKEDKKNGLFKYYDIEKKGWLARVLI
ncbi:hypothetical protein FMM55_03905 [Campylobacter sp. LR196d]|uniref:toxin-antitoxin system YwqK family antitoxin n=1 Tax=Campylobacter sp. LR185c TaxID=2014525 RepID=UPI001238351B|nr:hypothetical protein [Campylobacter sp. LR185c]KAA6225275.1 hypothetical protein FMM57_07795 [Campylobacter sp. LR286c]KAA6226929.1 hypothetical protein FMM55_03905 [Campylobacter sp. LR196d]KAA6227666.1 hypothetical protein FMM54_02470 [Campylobacter sp. LR185c]